MTARELYINHNMSLSDIAVALGRSKSSVYAELKEDNTLVMRPRGGPHKKHNQLIRSISDERLFTGSAEALAEQLGVHWTTIYKIRRERKAQSE